MDELVVLGTVLTVDGDRRTHARGAVYVHDGVIEAVSRSQAAPPAGFGAAPRVRADGVVAPGLIDLHNHLAYNTLPLWVGRRRGVHTRYQWPGAATYGCDVSNPAQALGIAAPAAALRYAEVKAVVGGVTAIQGSPPLTRAFPGWMVRNVEKEKHGIRQRDLPVGAAGDRRTARHDRRHFAQRPLVHLPPCRRSRSGAAQGVHAARRSRLRRRRPDRHPLDGADRCRFRASGMRPGGGAIVWSPFSNLWLYGGTTDVLARAPPGLRVCLGSDWTPSGTRNVLGELKVAATLERVTRSAARRARGPGRNGDRQPGRHARPGHGVCRSAGSSQGALADLACFANVARRPVAHACSRATERHVQLVIVGGRPAYGNRSLLERRRCGGAEPITVAGVRRGGRDGPARRVAPDRARPAAPRRRSRGRTGCRSSRRLGGSRRAVRRARGDARSVSSRCSSCPTCPEPDGGEARALTDDELDQLAMPTFDGIGHTAAWFERVRRSCPDHAEILCDLGDEF